MYEIVTKETVAPNIIHMKFKAPKIASSAKPGQFVIIRVDEKGERIPMGLAGWDEKEGTVDIVFYVLGTSTAKLSTMCEGDSVANIAGPLGKPSDIENFGRVICACGCFGVGPSLPLVKALKEKGNYVITVVEGRGPDFVFWMDRLGEFSDEVHVVTGCGKTAWANDFIEQEIQSGRKIDRIFAHGCPFMMKVSSDASRAAGVDTTVSLTPIMVDGTGMCGACRVEVGGETKFACVDGPEFEGHDINWDGLVLRLRQLIPEEDKSFNIWERDNWHKLMDCRHKKSFNPAKRMSVEEIEHTEANCKLQGV
ncbi:MAG: sulfide/dihydroorotate dehydrogenase-like FAD/NAD-binding protein [Methanothrix sp.]|jgi:ferredoxin--NADP+ reductase|uniref:sulfide/dihydroorotate dehydrogenase-like FAD/NAD-binding protein n=1 Tax=Methanothrix sp. TaxID=90426 RepID=UPI003BB664EF